MKMRVYVLCMFNNTEKTRVHAQQGVSEGAAHSVFCASRVNLRVRSAQHAVCVALCSGSRNVCDRERSSYVCVFFFLLWYVLFSLEYSVDIL